jgi:hypothetical protein
LSIRPRSCGRRAGSARAAHRKHLAVAVALCFAACSFRGGPIPEPAGGSVPVSPETSLSFYTQASAFYARLLKRRFNTLETFNDPLLREHFRTENRFFDYYADLAQSFRAAYFERSRPERVSVQGFIFETPFLVHVQVRFVGADRRPLRPDKIALVRLDRWERVDGRWWVTPEKL